MLKSVCTALVLSSLAFAAGPSPSTVQGEYIEARNTDVWTGPCFANGEVEINGKDAILGWKIDQGSWDGVSLEGLAVAAVIRTPHTLGNVSEPLNPGRAVLVVDERANAAQRAALQAFAESMAGDLVSEVVRVYYAPVNIGIEDGNVHGGVGWLTAGSLAAIETRALDGGDVHCGNELLFYPPLSAGLDHSMAAFAETNTYSGVDLGERWKAPNQRSGFLGFFKVSGGQPSAAAE